MAYKATIDGILTKVGMGEQPPSLRLDVGGTIFALLCVVCDKPCQYVQDGDSVCLEHLYDAFEEVKANDTATECPPRNIPGTASTS